MVWSLLVVGIIVAAAAARSRTPLRRRFAFLTRRVLRLLTLAAVAVAVNWGVYIWAVNHGHVVDASLGYYINPLVSVALAVLVLRERLNRVQWVALGVAAAGVVELTVAAGHPPVVALALAASFGIYGLLKNLASAPAVEALAVETSVLFLPALAFLVVLRVTGRSSFGADGAGHAALLASTGLVTALPLLLFGAAATRIPLSTLGVLQYVNPTMQLLLGVVVLGEGLSGARLAGFAIVWAALLLFTFDAVRSRPRRRPAGGAVAGPAADPVQAVPTGR